MQALVFNEASNDLHLRTDYPVPLPKDGEALIEVIRAGICSTDLEIIKGYVPGFNHVLGHEFVGRVVKEQASRADLVGKRVVGEINCNDCKFCCSDAIFQRNHAPGRSVLGIIGKDGTMAQYLTLPVSNLHLVPDEVSDQEACFTEPLAAACRILEQGLPKPGSKVAVIGDGKLGLLVAQVLAAHGSCDVTLIGRHLDKMQLVSGVSHVVLTGKAGAATAAAAATEPADAATTNGGPAAEADSAVSKPAVADMTGGLPESLQGQYDLCVDASGSSAGVYGALYCTRPLGTILLKSTVSLKDPHMPAWSAVANDIVVNEKVLVGSRCGPFDVALKMLSDHASVRQLVNAMTCAVYPMEDAVKAISHAQQKGALKVQLEFTNSPDPVSCTLQ